MTGQFKTRLFGYCKRDVRDYVSKLNEEFSQKLLEREKESRDSAQALQKELDRLRQENEQFRAERQKVAGVLIDARYFAAGLKEQAAAEDRVQRSKNAEFHQVERQRLQAFAGQIEQMRKSLHSTLNRMDEELEQYELNCQALQEGMKTDPPHEEVGAQEL